MKESQVLRALYGKASRHARLLQVRYGGYTLVQLLAGRCGFFGNMFMTLNGLRLCEAAGVQPQPSWGPESLFYDSTRGANAWLYYFKEVPPLSGKVAEQVALRQGRTLSFKPTATTIFPLYNGLGIRESYARCVHRHVRLRDDLREDLENTAKRLFSGRHVLGVHVRLTDTMGGYESRRSFGLESYFLQVDAYLERYPSSFVFVATDSAGALDALRARYGQRLLALDCIRSTSGVSIHGHYDAGVPGTPFQKGLDVIRDAYLLSRVRHLIRVHSRVTAFSLCLNPDLDFTDVVDKDVPGGDPVRLPWLRAEPQRRGA